MSLLIEKPEQLKKPGFKFKEKNGIGELEIDWYGENLKKRLEVEEEILRFPFQGIKKLIIIANTTDALGLTYFRMIDNVIYYVKNLRVDCKIVIPNKKLYEAFYSTGFSDNGNTFNKIGGARRASI